MNSTLLSIIIFLKEKIDHIKGWYELTFVKDEHYKYRIEEIKLINDKDHQFSMLKYKMAGIRKPRNEKISEINMSNVFSLFTPEHAQMIVSIATLEAVLNRSKDEVFDKYKRYISFCNEKVNKE